MPLKSKWKCPYCKSRDTTWKGYRVRAHDKAHMRHCNNCSRKFTTKETRKLKGRPRTNRKRQE